MTLAHGIGGKLNREIALSSVVCQLEEKIRVIAPLWFSSKLMPH